MSSSTGNSANLPQTTPEQVDSLVRSALGTADSGSTQAIENLTFIQQARISQLKRTAAGAMKRFGADNAETKAAEAAAQAGTARLAAMTAVHFQAATPSLQVSATGWAVHGRVFAGSSTSSAVQLDPVANLTVFLVDSQKKYQGRFGFAYTDVHGYFVLNYAGTKSEAQTDGQLFVEIADSRGQPIYLSPTPLPQTPGSATYLNIVLPADQKPLGDPPAEIRGGAFPGAPKKA